MAGPAVPRHTLEVGAECVSSARSDLSGGRLVTAVPTAQNGNNAGAEAVEDAEGDTCGTAMRGAVALPGSEATSRTKGTRRNLGDLLPGWAAPNRASPHREGEEP
jgi:hypothetical protein